MKEKSNLPKDIAPAKVPMIPLQVDQLRETLGKLEGAMDQLEEKLDTVVECKQPMPTVKDREPEDNAIPKLASELRTIAKAFEDQVARIHYLTNRIEL